jgi:hypothetical protein
MTSNKTVLTKLVEWTNYRKFNGGAKGQGVKSVKRVEIQSAAEMANGLKFIFLDAETLQEIARQTGGTYVPGTNGNSKIKFN